MIDYSDQVNIFNPHDWGWPIHIIGMGGIGSAVFLPLLKLGVPKIHIWDDDQVESRNVPAQLIYRTSDVGLDKVEAARKFAKRQEAETKVKMHRRKVDASTKLEGVVISAVDDPDERKAIWGSVKGNAFVPLFMDGRIGSEVVHQFSVNPLDAEAAERYETTLFAKGQEAPLPCGERTIIHPPAQVAVWVVANLTLFARGKPLKSSLMAGLQGMQYVAS